MIVPIHMDTEHKTHQAFRNTAYRLAGYFLPAILSVVITPIIISRLGIKDYGVMIFINAVLSILSLLDAGITSATIKHLAEYLGKKDEEGVKKLIPTSHSLFLIVGATGLLSVIVFLTIAWFFFHDKIINNPIFIPIALIAAVTFFVSSISTVYTIVPTALQRFDIQTKFNAISLVLISVANLAVVLLGGKLIAIFIPQLVVGIIFFFVWRHYAHKALPFAHYGFGWSIFEIKRSLSFSAYSIVNELARTSLFSLDRLIMPFYLGATNLAYYTIPGNLTTRISSIADTISGVIFPMSAHLHGAGDKETMRTVYIRSTRLIFLTSSAITMAIVLNGYSILRYWINSDVANNAAITIVILAFTQFILSLMSPTATFLMVLGKWKLYTSISAVMATVNIIAIFIFIPYGINGVAFAYLLATPPVLYAIYHLETHYLNITDSIKRWSLDIGKLLITTLIFAVINIFLINPLIHNLLSLVIMGPVSVLVYILIYYVLGFMAKEDSRDIFAFLKRQLSLQKTA